MRILALRPINCEHARGPAFQLSGADREVLEEQIAHGSEDPRLADLICLGWFVSHTPGRSYWPIRTWRFTKYFAEPWQVTLIIRPGRGGKHPPVFDAQALTARFAAPVTSRLFGRLAEALDRPARGDPRGADTPCCSRTGLRRPPELAPALLPGPQLLPTPAPRAKWPWLLVWGIALLVAVLLGVRYFVMQPAATPLDLSVIERNGQLQIEWNRGAKPVSSAVRGALLVTDGQVPHTIPLTLQELERGAFSYQRTSEDVEVRMSVEDAAGGSPDRGTCCLPGFRAAKPAGDGQALESGRRDDLQAEVSRLSGEDTPNRPRAFLNWAQFEGPAMLELNSVAPAHGTAIAAPPAF